MIIFDNNSNTFYSTLINDQTYLSGFGNKKAGSSNRITEVIGYFDSIHLEYKKIVDLEQIHSANATEFISINNDKIIKINDTDGVVTNEADTVLYVKTADCVPMLFSEKKLGIVGASHQGWRGSLKRLPQKMISKMASMGADINSICVAIGPAINSCCYDIDDDRYYAFLEEFDGYSEKIFSFRKGKRHMSLSHLNYLLLLESGIKKSNIDYFPFCTYCDKDNFYSYRRDNKKSYGEMLSFIYKYGQV